MGDQIVFGRTQNAEQTPFDNSTNGFVSEDVQAAIEEVLSGLVLFNVPRDSAVGVGDAVYLNASGTAFQAQADAFSTSNVMGLVERISSGPDLCDIRVTGKTEANFVGLDPSLSYFLSSTTAGALQTTPPIGSGEVVLRVAQPFSATRHVVVKDIRMVRA